MPTPFVPKDPSWIDKLCEHWEKIQQSPDGLKQVIQIIDPAVDAEKEINHRRVKYGDKQEP